MREGDRKILLGFSIFLMFIGIIITVALPYERASEYSYYNPSTKRYETRTSIETVYGNPVGWVIAGIGFFMFLGAFLSKPESSKPSTQRT